MVERLAVPLGAFKYFGEIINMICPICGNDKTKIDQTRVDNSDGSRVNRYRRCLSCGAGWPTREIPEPIYFEMCKVRGGDRPTPGR